MTEIPVPEEKKVCRACNKELPKEYQGGACPYCHTVGVYNVHTGPNRKQRRAIKALARRVKK